MTMIFKNFQHRVLLPFFALFFLMGVITVQAATYYVATTGNDASTCATAQSITTPKRTIASGVACLNPGDKLFIRSGTWTEPINLTGKSGTVGNYITIAAYPGETVTLATYSEAVIVLGYAYIIFDGLIFDGVNGGDGIGPLTVQNGAHDVIIQNNTIKNWKYHGIIFAGDNITIRNNTIKDQISVTGVPGTRWYGIYAHSGTNILIENNVISHNPGGGMQASPGPINKIIIRNNAFYSNGFLTSSPVGGICVSGGTGLITGAEVYNNLVYGNGVGQSSVASVGIVVANKVDGAKVWNNTVYGNNGWGINVQQGTYLPTNTLLQNNIVYGNVSGPITNDSELSIIDHNLITNPNFVKADASDFRLQTGSPAIDAGITLSQVKTDIKMVPRPQGLGHDIGAYESSTTSSSAPAPPKNLQVR